MKRTKLAVLLAGLAAATALIVGIYSTLDDDEVADFSAASMSADPPIGRSVAHTDPADTSGWLAWSRGPHDLRSADLLGEGDGAIEEQARAGLSPRTDENLGRVASARIQPLAEARTPRKREGVVDGRSYRTPNAGRRTILTSGRRIGQPDIQLPDTAVIALALQEKQRIPVRVEVCVNESGRPREAHVIQGTGSAAVDHFVARQLLEGRYRPLSENGRRVAFCERATIILGS